MLSSILVGIRIKNKFETLPVCLVGLAFQTFKDFDVYIYDESDVPVTDFYPIRLAMDLLQLHYKIDIFHQRRIESRNVAQALIKLFDYTTDKGYNFILMLDADMVMTPNCLGQLFDNLKEANRTIFVEPTVIDVNNSLNHSDYSLRRYSIEDVNKFSRWGVNHQYFDSSVKPIKRKVSTASIPLIDMSKVSTDTIKKMKEDLNHLGDLPGEDIIMFRRLTESKYHGLLIPSAIAYHFAHIEHSRDWYKILRQLQNMIADWKI